MPKNTKRTSQSESRLKMTGKLELPIGGGSNEEKGSKEGGDVSDVHGGLKQLVQAVHPLHELERDAD